MASRWQRGFVPAGFHRQASCYCLRWICITSFCRGREFCSRFCFTLSGDGEVWPLPWLFQWTDPWTMKKVFCTSKRCIYGRAQRRIGR